MNVTSPGTRLLLVLSHIPPVQLLRINALTYAYKSIIFFYMHAMDVFNHTLSCSCFCSSWILFHLRFSISFFIFLASLLLSYATLLMFHTLFRYFSVFVLQPLLYNFIPLRLFISPIFRGSFVPCIFHSSLAFPLCGLILFLLRLYYIRPCLPQRVELRLTQDWINI